MKKLIIIFLMSSVQALFTMEFPITEKIKTEMKALHPAKTLCPDHHKPAVEHYKAPSRVLIAKMNIVFGNERYIHFETNEQVTKLANQIEGDFLAGKVWKIDWFYYDEEVAPEVVRSFHSYIRDSSDSAELSCASDDPY